MKLEKLLLLLMLLLLTAHDPALTIGLQDDRDGSFVAALAGFDGLHQDTLLASKFASHFH